MSEPPIPQPSTQVNRKPMAWMLPVLGVGVGLGLGF
jgi:hypothetical protein